MYRGEREARRGIEGRIRIRKSTCKDKWIENMTGVKAGHAYIHIEEHVQGYKQSADNMKDRKRQNTYLL